MRVLSSIEVALNNLSRVCAVSGWTLIAIALIARCRASTTDFCRSIALPVPTIVFSGHGLHCYWSVDHDLTRDEWESIAGKLKTAAQKYLPQADGHVRVADISSILRPPGTVNHKSTPVSVLCGPIMGPYGIGEFNGLDRFGTSSNPNTPNNHSLRDNFSNLRPSYVGSGNFLLNKALSNVHTTEPIDFDLLINNCGQLKRFREIGAIGEPLWYASLGVLAYADGGEAIAHQWRSQFTEYNAAETNRRFARVKQLTGPTTRGYFESLAPEICRACTFQCKIGPIEAGRPVRIQREYSTTNGLAQIHENITPDDFIVMSNGGVQYVTEDENGKANSIKVTGFPVHVQSVHVGELDAHKNYYLLHHFKPHAGWQDIALQASDLANDAVVPRMADHGILVFNKLLFIRYIRESVEIHEQRKCATVSFEQFGWKDERGRLAFLYGDRLYSSDDSDNGVSTTAISAELAYRAPWLRPVPGGSLSAWKQAVDSLMGRGSEGMSFTVLASFAAPLMRLLEVNEGGAVISLVTRHSGAGKSTALAGARSVWASDKRALDLVDIDTRVSKSVVLGVMCNLPVTFDEFQNRDPAVVAQFMVTFTNGRDKNRADSQGHLIHSAASWQTLLLTAGNQSLVDTIKAGGATEAPAMRILEMPVESSGEFKQSELMALADVLAGSAGHAGDAYLRYLVQPQTLAWVRTKLPETVDEIMEKCRFGKEHRFWARTLAAVGCASTIVNKLGLVSFSPDRIMSWAIDHFGEAGTTTSSAHDRSSMLEHLAAFLNERIDEILHMPSAAQGRTHIPPIGDLPRKKICARLEHDTMTCFVSEVELRRWLEANAGGGFSALVQELKAADLLICEHRSKTLGAGTKLTSGQVWALGFDVDAPAFTGFVREVKEEIRKDNVVRKLGAK